MNKSDIIGVLKSKKLTLIVTSIFIAGSFSITRVQADPLVTRYSGMDRYETAAKVCEDGWQSTSDYVVIVNGENFPDALSAAPLAKKYNAPILLTGADILNPYTSSEISRLNVKNAFLIGGKGVISQSVEDALKARRIKITRIGGVDRYDTALQVAAKLGKSNEVALVNGNDFRDGMSIASIAALKGMPVILTDGITMPDSVKKYFKSNAKMDQIYVIGDENSISSDEVSGLSNIKRIGSGNIYKRNTDIINAFQNEINTSTLYIASAKDFPDSLGASALAPRTSSPILFVDGPIPSSTQDFLKAHIITNVKILGGNGAVSYDAEQVVKNLPLGIGSTENLTDTIWQSEKYTPRPTVIITATDGNKKEVFVDWNLTKINTTKPGVYTFTGTIRGTDKTVYTTLLVKPLPYKIDDITNTASSRNSFDLPTTVSAQMTDGTKSDVAVKWDYGTQQKNNPGVYVFYGTVDKYNKKVKLTLNIDTSSSIASIQDFKKIFATSSDMNTYLQTSLPSQVTAKMDDGTTKSMSITWDPISTVTNGTAVGTHILKGTVSGYASKVNLLMIVTSEGGVDPNPGDSGNSGSNGGGGTNSSDTRNLGELSPIMQGDPYPSTITDPITRKQVQVTWNNAVSIDTTFVDSEYIDDCRVSKVTLEGVISGSNSKVRATIGIIPKVVAITADQSTVNVPMVVITINRSQYPDGIFSMSEASNRLSAVIVKPDGTRVAKHVHVLLWNPPYIDISNSNTYYVNATINNYSTPVVVTLKVQ